MASLFAKPVQDTSPLDPAMLQHIALPENVTLPAMPAVKMPQVTEQPTPMQQEIANTSGQLKRIEWNRAHPWGTAENHPGKLGKIAHGFSVLGNIAGDIFAPATMALIPGTQMNMEMREGGLANRLGKESEEERTEQQEQSEEPLRAAQTQKLTEPPAPAEQRPYTLPTDKGELQWNGHSWEPIEVGGETAFAPEKPGTGAHLQHVSGTYQGKAAFGNYNPLTGVYTDDQGNVLHGFAPENKAMQGAFGSYAPVRLVTSLLQMANSENPDLLPLIAPLAAKVMSQYGANPQQAESVISQPAPGQPRNVEGHPIGLRMPEAPTGATRSRGQFSEAVLPDIDSAEQNIESMRDELGPMAGRWNELYTAKVGAFGPQFSGLQTQLKNIGTAWMRLHANSESARQEFEGMLRGAQNPDNLIANLKAIEQQAQSYVKEGKGRPDELGMEAREYQGHSYKKGADGQWHLQQK